MKDVFSLENGDLTLEYPATFTQGDFEDVCDFLAIWMRVRKRSIPALTGDELTGCADDALPGVVVDAIREHLNAAQPAAGVLRYLLDRVDELEVRESQHSEQEKP